MWQREGGLADPFRGNAAHRRLARANGATLRDRSPVTSIRDAGGGDLEVVTPDATYRTGRVVLAADAWTNELLASFDRRLPLTDHQGAGDLLRLPRPGGLRARPVPGLDLDGRAVLLRLPDVRRGRTEGGPGLRRPAGRAGRPDVRARRGRLRERRARSWRAICRARSARRSTPRPASTRSPRIATSWSIACPRRPGVIVGARGRARLQVRLGPRPDHGRAARRRGDPVGRRSRPIPDRSTDPARDRPRDVLDGLTRAGARYGSPFAPNVLLCHRTASFGRGRAPPEGDFVCDSPCVPGRRASSPW